MTQMEKLFNVILDSVPQNGTKNICLKLVRLAVLASDFEEKI